jgi:hypothetical protein
MSDKPLDAVGVDSTAGMGRHDFVADRPPSFKGATSKGSSCLGGTHTPRFCCSTTQNCSSGYRAPAVLCHFIGFLSKRFYLAERPGDRRRLHKSVYGA